MKKKSQLGRNLLILSVVAWTFLGVAIAHTLSPSHPQGTMYKFPAMVMVGTVFGCVGFRLAILIKKRFRHKPKTHNR